MTIKPRSFEEIDNALSRDIDNVEFMFEQGCITREVRDRAISELEQSARDEL